MVIKIVANLACSFIGTFPDFGNYHVSTGCRNIFYGILSGDQSACYGSGKRIGSGKSGFCNRAWNCVYRVYSERSFPERILDREKTQKTAKRKDMIEKVAVSYRLVLQ